MKNAMKGIMAVMVIAIVGMILDVPVLAGAKVKTEKFSCTVYVGKTKKWSDPYLVKAKKIKVKSSNRKIASVSLKKSNVLIKGKTTGTARVTVHITTKNGKKVKFVIKVKVKDEEKVVKHKAKEAFAIQNRYRKEKGSASLEWSDELYRFAQYRIKTSGYDGHKNLERDKKNFFGDFAENNYFTIGENLHVGMTTAKDAMKSWKDSSGHYKNLLRKEYVCGAIAVYGDVWCAVFMETTFDTLRSSEKVKVILKRYDTASGTYVSGSKIAYYEENDKWGTQKTTVISEPSGKAVFLEVGKTYVVYEMSGPDGCAKAEKVVITVTRSGPAEIVLSD